MLEIIFGFFLLIFSFFGLASRCSGQTLSLKNDQDNKPATVSTLLGIMSTTGTYFIDNLANACLADWTPDSDTIGTLQLGTQLALRRMTIKRLNVDAEITEEEK